MTAVVVARDPRDIAHASAASAAVTDMNCATGFSAGVRWCPERLDEVGERAPPEVALAILIGIQDATKRSER